MCAARTLSEPSVWSPSRLLAWVLMPDHWHGLVELGETSRLDEAMRRFKGRVAREVNFKRKVAGRVWQAGFHDCALRGEPAIEAAARYLVCNPVRAGLVRQIGDYPYWDAVWLDGRG